MKSFLIVLNILLAGAVIWGGAGFIKNISSGKPKTTFTVKKRNPKTARISPAADHPEKPLKI